MGLQDRDYWKERYDENLNARRNTQDNPFVSEPTEMSFLSKFILTIAFLLVAALAYRYQSEISKFLRGYFPTHPQRSVVLKPEPPASPPKVLAPESPRFESTGQIYRCGSTYSNESCEGGRPLEQQPSRPVDRSVTKQIYLCKDFQGNLTWESVQCSINGRFMDRIASVPANIPWNEQVEIARQQRDRAHAIAAEQVVPVATRPSGGNVNSGECQALEERVNWLDSLGRIGGGGYTMDWIRDERRKARDRQFRIGC